MSAPTSSSVVVPTKDGAPQPGGATAVTKMAGGGLLLSPLPLGGGKRRKTRRISKKVLRMFKKGSKGKLMKLMKGGQEAEEVVTNDGESAPESGAARRRSRRGSRKSRKGSRKHAFLY